MDGTVAASDVARRRFVVCDVALFYAERSGGIRSTLLVDLLPQSQADYQDRDELPFAGSIAREALSMGTEAAVETRRKLGARASTTRKRLSPFH